MKSFFILFIFLVSTKAYSLDLYGVYLGSCRREIGTIVNVKDQSFDILTVAGDIKTFPRYQAIYLSTYPLDILPNSKLNVPKGSEVYNISTQIDNNITPLLRGWAINFTTDQISFLSLDGKEILVDGADLWKIAKEKIDSSIKKTTNGSEKIHFIDPYPFSHCKRTHHKKEIIPQKLFSDAVDIKREFDRLQKGHQKLSTYIRRQIFYPKPEVYKNMSSLGLWLMTGSRYGASGSRASNFSPFLSNELSLGPYSYQHLITTGSGPLPDGTHSEIQTHFYYRMKAEYIHLSIMADPNLLLVGDQYDWTKNDLNPFDFRLNESFYMEFGFDLGNFSLEFSPIMESNAAFRLGDTFQQTSEISLVRYGLRYTGVNYTTNFMFGSFKKSFGQFAPVYDDNGYYIGRGEFSGLDVNLNFFRINFEKPLFGKHKIKGSFIYKKVTGKLDEQSFDFKSMDFSALYTHRYKKRFFFSGLLGIENYKMTSEDQGDNKVAFKFGGNASLKF